MKNVGRIESYTVTRQWDVTLDGKSYQVKLIQGARAHRYDPQAKAWVPGERWVVYGGGYTRNHLCDEDKTTHKRVVAWVKAQLAQLNEFYEPPIDPTTGRPANFRRETGAWITIAEASCADPSR